MRRARVISMQDRVKEEVGEGWGIGLSFISEEIGARNADLTVYQLNPGMGHGPYHSHSTSECIYYVSAGELSVRIRSNYHHLRVGDAVFIPPGEPHSVANPGQAVAELIEVYAPPGADFIVEPEV